VEADSTRNAIVRRAVSPMTLIFVSEKLARKLPSYV